MFPVAVYVFVVTSSPALDVTTLHTLPSHITIATLPTVLLLRIFYLPVYSATFVALFGCLVYAVLAVLTFMELRCPLIYVCLGYASFSPFRAVYHAMPR